MREYETVIVLKFTVNWPQKQRFSSGCTTEFGGEPNTMSALSAQVCQVLCPVLNKQVVAYALSAGVALNCDITQYSKFDRKNYFYPDLPKAYQITQFDHPICTGGYITVTGGKDIRINHIHIEEDAGKLVHDDYEAFQWLTITVAVYRLLKS